MSTRPNCSKVANEKAMWMDGQESNRNNESIQFHCTIKHETRKAVLIIVDDKEIWLPKSMVELDMVGDDTAIVSIPEWLGQKAQVGLTLAPPLYYLRPLLVLWRLWRFKP